MTSAWWLLLLGAAVSHMAVAQEQPLPDDEDALPDEGGDLSSTLKRAQGALIRGILRRIEEEQTEKDSDSPALEWISKRQHPGKRLLEEVEKRQHPGKREEDDSWYLELPKRQHPGRRSPFGEQMLDNSNPPLGFLPEVSKRQHPGKRGLAYAKRQHPGKRGWDEEEDVDFGDFQEVDKRQHPGKRYLEPENFDYVPPCEGPDPFNCSKGSLLLELLDNANRGRLEEKRQHPGRRSAWEAEVPVAQE